MSTGSKDLRASAHIALVGGLSSDEVWMANVSHRKIRKILSEVHREFMASRYYDPQESAGKTKRATVMKPVARFNRSKQHSLLIFLLLFRVSLIRSRMHRRLREWVGSRAHRLIGSRQRRPAVQGHRMTARRWSNRGRRMKCGRSRRCPGTGTRHSAWSRGCSGGRPGTRGRTGCIRRSRSSRSRS